jgi:hypothetical protein
LAAPVATPVAPVKVVKADPVKDTATDSHVPSYALVEEIEDKTPAHWNAIAIGDEVFEFANSVVRQSFVGTIADFNALLK